MPWLRTQNAPCQFETRILGAASRVVPDNRVVVGHAGGHAVVVAFATFEARRRSHTWCFLFVFSCLHLRAFRASCQAVLALDLAWLPVLTGHAAPRIGITVALGGTVEQYAAQSAINAVRLANCEPR